MKIDYKITTIVLVGILLVTYTWHWDTIFFHNQGNMMGGNKMSRKMMGNMHKMPDGSMMMNDGSMMDEDMSMGNMTMDDMVNDLKGKGGKELEKAFVFGMIPHHQGAVDMAKMILQDKTINPKFVKFANDIIKAQEAEIKMMKEWSRGY